MRTLPIWFDKRWGQAKPILVLNKHFIRTFIYFHTCLRLQKLVSLQLAFNLTAILRANLLFVEILL